MLISFSVSNYRSFDEEQTFSLVASKRHTGEHKNHALPIPGSDEEVLRTAVLYGANGAGKSNLFKALQFVKDLATKTRDRDELIDREPFLLRGGNRPSTFDVHFLAYGNQYRYGVTLDDSRVIEEWLARVDRGSEIHIFERSTSREGKVQVNLAEPLAEDGGSAFKMQALATVGGLQNQTFIATVFATLEVEDWPDYFTDVYLWFAVRLQLVHSAEPGLEAKGPFATDPDLRQFAGQFLNAASTGIDHLAAIEAQLSEDEVSNLVPARVRLRFLTATEGEPITHTLPNGNVIVASRSGDEFTHKLIEVEAAHRDHDGRVVPFRIEQESDGTQRLLQLIPALHAMQKDPKCYVIDEIDRSMHPILVRDFLRYFLESCEGKGAQLIVTTHESNLLDQELLRRDEIWFAEKNQQGATTLYSLLDFNPRNDMQLRKNYLQGRFGAVPFLGRIEDLLDKERKVS